MLATVVAIVTLVPAIAMIAGGLRMVRRPQQVPRVPIDAVVVEYSNYNRAKRVTFDYPAPDGTWLRATRMAGLATLQTQGFLVQPGDRIRAYVNPADPVDVSLGAVGSAGGLFGAVLLVVGVLLGVAGLGAAGQMALYAMQ